MFRKVGDIMDEILIASRNTIYMLDRLIYYIRNDIRDEENNLELQYKQIVADDLLRLREQMFVIFTSTKEVMK